MARDPFAFWSVSEEDLFARLDASKAGLTSDEAARRLARDGPNLPRSRSHKNDLALFFSQLASPIILVLLAAAVVSLVLSARTDALTILLIVFASSLLGFWQERGAAHAVGRLLATVQVRASVVRNGASVMVGIEEVVSGDIVVLAAGDLVPGDGRVLAAKDLFVSEAAITGETFPAEKAEGVIPAESPLAARTNALYMGTHVVSGTARMLVVRTGRQTEFGKVAERLRLRPAETEFERGIRRFGTLLLELTLLLTLAIFAFNVYLHRPVLESFLFAVALAVGLTPQLLPAVISVNLSHGARRMAKARVIVKRLAAIENFGSMNVLCTDKTGTVTEATFDLEAALDARGNPSERVLRFAYLNAIHETGFANPVDEAIRKSRAFDITDSPKLDEVPYDFIRRRLSILVGGPQGSTMITKGALPSILSVCTRAEGQAGEELELAVLRADLDRQFEAFGQQGHRVLGIAIRPLGTATVLRKEDETGMTFVGLLVFAAPLKPGVAATVRRLAENGVSLKIVTGDSRAVATHVAEQLGLAKDRLLTGPLLRQMSNEALLLHAGQADIFAEVEPNQKERIVLALRKAGNVVGYMGDGINDASAIHAADVGLSVDLAVDVAKDAADIVLLDKDLGVLLEGVREGRITFANTLKYVFMATSANFGNMFSMAGASLFLPFLPLLPKQVLLTNLLTDLPEMTIAADRVDEEWIARPRRWDIGFIRRFMMVFGLVSSVFDYLTFALLWWVLRAPEREFRTGWFVESVISASVVVLIIRSRRPFFQSKPGRALLLATIGVAVATSLLPLTPFGAALGLTPLPLSYFGLLGVVLGLYVATAELAKRVFYRHMKG